MPARKELGLVVLAEPKCFESSVDTNDDDGADDAVTIDRCLDHQEHGPPFLLREHNLGVAFWCIPKLLSYALSTFQSLVPQLHSDPSDEHVFLQLHNCTRVIVLINADHYTAWNIRRRLIDAKFCCATAELDLLNLVFSKHPKSGEAWAHRRWIIAALNRSGHSSMTTTKLPLFRSEMDSCARFAELYPRNYYAWSHRQWLTDQLCSIEELQQIVIESRQWSYTHVSDHSALSHRQTLFKRLISLSSPDCCCWSCESGDNSCRDCQLWKDELTESDSLLSSYPGHESGWCHRRFLWHCATRVWRAQLGGIEWAQKIRKIALDEVNGFAQECVQDDGASMFETQRRFAASYQFWVLHSTNALLQSVLKEPGFDAGLRSRALEVGNQLIEWAPTQQRCWRRLVESMEQ